MPDRDTGLGSSLLLKRTTGQDPKKTDAPDKPVRSTSTKRPNVSDVQTPGIDERQLQVPRDRCTLYLDQDVNERLDLVARVERKQRSEVVTEILRQHLPEYQIARGGK